MNITEKDYTDFRKAYNKLGVIFSIGDLNIKNLKYLAGSKKYKQILEEYLLELEASFENLEYTWKQEGGFYERSVTKKIEVEEYELDLSYGQKYKFAFYEIVEEVYPSIAIQDIDKNLLASLYFYNYPAEYKNAKKLFIERLSIGEKISTSILGPLFVAMGIGLILVPIIELSIILSDVLEIKKNSVYATATVVDKKFETYKKKKGGTGVMTADIVEFNGHTLETKLLSGYNVGDQFPIVYSSFNPSNFYIGKQDRTTLSVLLSRYNTDIDFYDYFKIVWLIISIGVITFGTVKVISYREMIGLFFKHNTNQIVKNFNKLIETNERAIAGNKNKISKYLVVRVLKIVLILFLLIALSGEDYSYYLFLRWSLFISIPFLLLQYSKSKDYNWFSVFLIIWLVFNPIIPFHFGRDTWALIDLATIIAIIVSFFFEQRNPED